MSAADVLTGLAKKARSASDALTVPVYDHIEQKSRDKTRAPTEYEKQWDRWMELRRTGAPEAEQEAARQKLDGMKP